MMYSIKINVVSHDKQRYETIGDWVSDADGNWTITVSQLGDWRMNLLVAVHEIVEQALCTHRGIPEAVVTAFDHGFEASRAEGNDEEPGDHPTSPYRKEHRTAERFERALAKELGVNWADYEKRIAAL